MKKNKWVKENNKWLEYKCIKFDSKNKKYYCPICALNNQQGYNNGNCNKRKEREDTRRKSSYC